MPMMSRSLVRSIEALRPGNWVFSKIPPLLAVACLDILRVGDDPVRARLLLGCYVWSIAAVAAFGHVVNDAFDVAADLRAGKPNQMADVGWPRRAGLGMALVLAGFAPAPVAHYTPLTLVLLALNFLWPTIYSVPGLRLKERGLAGLACDMLGAHVTPTLVALSVFGMASPPGSTWFVVIVTIWAALLGIKGILHHQVQDRANDIRSATVTFATRTSGEALSRFLTVFNLAVELPVSAALAFVAHEWAPFVAVVFVVYCAFETVKCRLGFQFALTSEPWMIRRSVPFVNESFYVLWLPLAVALQLAAGEVRWAWLPIAFVFVFYPNVSAQLTEIGAVLGAAGLKPRGEK